mmetsp:Transcript_18932/g.34190  ORF Transcript_18932/g.34190 Transcript_18932/m.34190 type:complete len:191 (-) Transcript_18932:35-607(-)
MYGGYGSTAPPPPGYGGAARPPTSYGAYGCCGNLYPDAPYGFAGIQDSGWERQKVQGNAYTTGVAPAYTPPLDVPGMGGMDGQYGMYGSNMMGPPGSSPFGYPSGGMYGPPGYGPRPGGTTMMTTMPGGPPGYPGGMPPRPPGYGGGYPGGMPPPGYGGYGGPTTMTTSMPMQSIPPPQMNGRSAYMGMR